MLPMRSNVLLGSTLLGHHCPLAMANSHAATHRILVDVTPDCQAVFPKQQTW
jgi:hypothetical protein